MKTQLFYCNSHYDINPIVDLNPLIPRVFPKGKVLAICAREQQVIRINNMANKGQFDSCNVVGCGWWELNKIGVINEQHHFVPSVLASYNAVVIVNRMRIHEMFEPLLRSVEQCLS